MTKKRPLCRHCMEKKARKMSTFCSRACAADWAEEVADIECASFCWTCGEWDEADMIDLCWDEPDHVIIGYFDGAWRVEERDHWQKE